MVLADFDIAKWQKQLKTIDFIDLCIKNDTKTIKQLTLLTFLMKMMPKPYKTIDFIDFYRFWDSSAQTTVGAQEF